MNVSGKLLSVAEAQQIVLQHARPLEPIRCFLDPGSVGVVLAEDVASDVDMPPHDKAMMDGYAVRSDDLAGGTTVFSVPEEVTAGKVPRFSLQAGQATRIMTGAPIPEGADAVVPVERTRSLPNDQVEIACGPPKPGQHIMPLGQEMRRGDIVLRAGSVLRPPELGVLATVGRTSVRAWPVPGVAVLCTGDELVEAPQLPGPGQIRNGNGPTIAAQVKLAGCKPTYLGIAGDSREGLEPLIAEGLSSHVLVLAGGVSAGKLDLVPGVLREMGVEPLFHKVEMKPGRPVYFGIRNDALIFGLPGNPVSAFVCFELFVRPALRRLAGRTDPLSHMLSATLTEDFTYRTDRPTYHPAWLEAREAGWQVRAIPWHGSPDLRGLTGANCFVLFLPEREHHHAGEKCMVLRMDCV